MLDSWLGRHTTLGANDTFHFERPDTAKTLSRTLVHPSGIEGLIILARGPRYSARGFPA